MEEPKAPVGIYSTQIFNNLIVFKIYSIIKLYSYYNEWLSLFDYFYAVILKLVIK